ncbi:MAG TPA: ABC transporter ATP-binding protein [Candidatus Binatia bacterium]|nr:ABC transporter ATP-binding protein [Candidatus Binatia bacterium]
MALLELHDVHVHYGNIHALKGISIEVAEGEIVTLIGANGAGKSTTLNAISGLVRPSAGSIRYDGQDITRAPAHEIVARGVVQVPEGRRIFARLTVRENLLMGAYLVRDRREIEAGIERVFAMFPRLKEREHQVCGTLSGGEQQMLAIGRALMTRPRVLLMDEPSMGLAPVLVDGIFATIRYLHEEGTTILLVEQNARMALSVADRGYVVETGRIVLADTAAALQANDAVRRAYLGIA